MADVSKATQMNNGLAIQVYNEQSCLLMEKRMRTAYQSAIDELQKELDDFYEKYATNNKIDLQVAKQKLSLSDSENVKDLAEQYKKLLSKKNIGIRTQKKLDEIAAKTKVSRLEQLLVNCTKQAAEVGMKAKDEMIDVGSLMYKDGFGHTMFNIQKTVGMGVNFNMPSARVIKTASNVEWLGATFTDRTGYTLDRLTNNIEQIIPQLFIQGKNADEFGKAIAKQFNMSENAAKRDMRTLTTLITNQASILAYNNCEMVEEFEFVATLDGRTSDKCRAMDGKRFKLNEAAPFINQPPLHYNCRSTTIPYFEDLDEYNPSERIARDEQGKTYMVPANMSYREWCTKHAQGLYANSDKTDWNYEPEKILAYERIVDERRKLKALQDDRVVYQDSDFVINHDISDYSEEEIEHLMQLFNTSAGGYFDILEQASNIFKQHSGNNYWGNFNTDIYDGWNANAKMKYNSLKFVGYNNTRGTLMGDIASYRNSFASIGNVLDIADAMKNTKLPKALRDVDREIFNRMLNIVSDALNPAKGNGLMRLVDERKQSIFLNLFNDKYINNGNIDIFVDVQRLILNNLSSFQKYMNDDDYKLLTSLRTKLDFNEISNSEMLNELYRVFNGMSEEKKASFMKNIEYAMYTYETKKINYLVDVDRNELNWGAKLIKPKIIEYEINKEQMKLLFIDALKGSYAVVNNSLDGFDDFINGTINNKDALQQKINETMTKINNIRKELNSDKTANILPAKDYNDIIGNLHKYYEMLNDEYDILNEKSSYQKYVKVMGLNDKPETMSKQDFQAYITDNKDLPVLYRAVTDAGPTGMVGGVTRGKYLRRGILNDLMYGSQQYIGDGVYGDGLYFSTQPTHGSYGSFSGSKETAIDRKYMIQATFKSGTKKILWDDLQKLMGEYRDKGYNIGDPSSFARSLGYQVIQCHRDGADEIYYNILDRSALVVQDVDKEGIDNSAKKEWNVKEIKQKIGDSIKQKAYFEANGYVDRLKTQIKNRRDGFSKIRDLRQFYIQKSLMDDETFSDFMPLIMTEYYTKDVVDYEIYQEAFENKYDEFVAKFKDIVDSEKDVIIKLKATDKEYDVKIYKDRLKMYIYEPLLKANGYDEKLLALDNVYNLLWNDLDGAASYYFVEGDDELNSDVVANDIKDFSNKFTKGMQQIIEDEIKRKQKGDKVDIKEIEKENKEVLNSIYEMYASPVGMANEMRYNKTFTFKKRDDNRDMFLIDLYTKQTLANNNIFKRILALNETRNMFSMGAKIKDVPYDVEEYYSEVYEEIVKMLEDCAEQSDTFDVEINVLNKKKMLPIAIDKTLKTFKDNDTDIQSKRDTVQKFIDKMQQVVNDEYYSEIEKNYDNLKIDNAFEISKNNLDIVRNEVQTFLNYRLRNAQQQAIDAIHTLTSEEIKALERKDTYDFKELQRKALKDFKYYKGTMKKAEIQNESLRKDERISKNNEKYFQQTMRDIFEKNDFCMRLNKNVLPLIAESKFMNQFETGNAPLGLTFGQRRAVAKKMFTIPEDAEGSEYEKYGFLGSKNPKDDFKDDENFTGDYGDTIVRFKKRNLMHRTTFTIGDSLFNCINDNVRSSPVINPQIASIQRGHVNEVIYGLNVVENADAEKSYLDIQALTRQKYVELQYHGNLTIDDVESVTFNKKTTNVNSPEVRKIIAMLKERGIKCYLVDSKKEVIQEI